MYLHGHEEAPNDCADQQHDDDHDTHELIQRRLQHSHNLKQHAKGETAYPQSEAEQPGGKTTHPRLNNIHRVEHHAKCKTAHQE